MSRVAMSPPISPQVSRSERPRPVTSMSHASTHSHKTATSRDERKLELTETSKDKRRLEGKSDPTKALNELQPAAVALQDASIDNIRDVKYKDRDGNFIADPDRSNPTRPRMERPLDTIRSFNDAADGTSNRRSSYQRQSSQMGGNWDAQSRRSSYYGPPSARPGPPAPRQSSYGGYYNRNNSQGYRPEMYAEDGGPVQQPPPRSAYHNRYQSAPPQTYAQEPPNAMHSHQQSYETMTSGSDEMSKSTDPSSQNSSFDQLHQMTRKVEGEQPTNPYRQQVGPMRNQYPPSSYHHPSNNQQPSGPTDDYGMEFQPAAPLPPPKTFNNGVRDAGPPMMSMKLQKTNSNHEPEPAPKRQSWIKKTFSRRS